MGGRQNVTLQIFAPAKCQVRGLQSRRGTWAGCFYLIVNVCYCSTPLISACSPQVLELMKEVAEEEDDENISSDISGNAL